MHAPYMILNTYLQMRMISKAPTAQVLGGPWCTSTNKALDLAMVLKNATWKQLQKSTFKCARDL